MSFVLLHPLYRLYCSFRSFFDPPSSDHAIKNENSRGCDQQCPYRGSENSEIMHYRGQVGTKNGGPEKFKGKA